MTDTLVRPPAASRFGTSCPDQTPSSVDKPARSRTPSPTPEDMARLDAACTEMESLFLHQLIKSMRDTVPRSGLFDDNSGEALYRDLLDAEYAKTMATSGAEFGGLGLKQALIRQMTAAESVKETEKSSK